MDAALSFLVAMGFSNALVLFLDQNENLTHEYLYQTSQDMMEVCSKKADFSEGCFGKLKEIGIHYAVFRNGHKEFGEEGKAEITIKRRFSDTTIELRTWA